MSNDIFDEPFDAGTIDKLQIFEDYFKEWLPVFLVRREIIWKEIQIFDLFGGEGRDVNGVLGSPMRILKTLNENQALIISSGVKVRIVINEFEKYKYEKLITSLESIANRSLYELECYNEDFIVVFDKYYESMKQTANFLFLDQNGIKQISQGVFSKLITLRQTDFLFFISSSFIKRFNDVDEFRKYISITRDDLEGKSYYHIHRIVLNYYRSLIPSDKRYYLAPFSIKKPAGIYGLIFGTNHTLGIEKFLHVCWRRDTLTGEANFDIDNEKINVKAPALFMEYNIPTKRQLFEKSLEQCILEGKLVTDQEVYLFTLNEGFLPKDANSVLKQLKNDNKIDFNFKPTSSDIHKIHSPSGIKIN